MALDFEKPLEEIENRISELKKLNEKADVSFDTEISALERKLRSTSKRVYSKLSPWETVQIARHAERPLLRDYIAGLCTEFLELHGDRCFGDDQGIIGGFATLRQHRVMVIGHQKGRSVEEKIEANFGMASPDGYRKAMRLMHLAAKYKLPIVSFIDTPGAYPGLEAEARGQAEAIARNLTEMSLLPVPVIVVVTGEGGSGGAIGIGVGNVVLMLSNAVYSVISPEGCASILWRDGSKAPEAAAALKITADSLAEQGIIDEIIPEPEGGAHRDPNAAIESTGDAIVKHLRRLKKMSAKRLIDHRYDKFSKIGRFKSRK
ncbi:MAG: acetyl-CoA carboxylase carboxyltransferase subunit alpha [Verrucomicrobia bacterium]|jgi:acetyl-CoA carboxylase carboxyl transferase subunit alpha|nr:acetyl-CoA carboxylase carboxyltransferase subunit alpha [Verrucomicrobiota bacterium]MBT7066188.1 acetyl-CoA carboxylase carboxyltransferase subunit alpha [Verrucomicrobiota bacterium]MBT7698779.1 acetyl-CoA carboxylase carboxyltransferase subunit alpha [Verrucomicrobiota bacterium]